MKVLIGVDGSSGAYEAVRQAGQVLSPEKDVVALYYAVPTVRVDSDAAVGPELLEKADQALVDAVFGEACTQLPAGFRQSVHRIAGHQRARHGLLVAADEIDRCRRPRSRSGAADALGQCLDRRGTPRIDPRFRCTAAPGPPLGRPASRVAGM